MRTRAGRVTSRRSFGTEIQIQVALTIGHDGLARTHGAAQVRDGTSNTVLIAEGVPTTASCADTDENGVAGLTLLRFVMRDVRSGDLVPVTVIPARGEIDESGEELVILVIADTTIVERVSSHVWGFLTRSPR